MSLKLCERIAKKESERSKLSNEFFHYSSSSELYTKLREEFSEAIELDVDVVDENDRNKPSENGEVNDDIFFPQLVAVPTLTITITKISRITT
jgi:hypothetical protein